MKMWNIFNIECKDKMIEFTVEKKGNWPGWLTRVPIPDTDSFCYEVSLILRS